MADYTKRYSGGGPVTMPPLHLQTESPYRGPRSSNGQHSPATSSTRSSAPHLPTPRPTNLGAGVNAFIIDPGAPFFATEGPSNSQSLDYGVPPQTGNGVSRKSRRDSERSKQPEGVPYGSEKFRDSGYNSSARIAQQIQPPPWPMNTNPPLDPPYPPSQPPHRDQERRQFYQDDEAVSVNHHELLSPDSIPSPVSAELEYAPGYEKMARHTPPPSDTSFNTYVNRFRHFVHQVKSLPWVANGRITADYCPGDSSPRFHPKLRRHPAISWHSQEYDRHNYHLAFDIVSGPPSSGDSSPTPVHYMASRQGPYADLDLADEFDDAPRHGPPPFGPHPPGLPQGGSYQVFPGGPPPADSFPQLPGDYVLPSGQHVGWQYGVPTHMTQPSVVMAQPIYVPMPPGSYFPVQ